MTKAKRADAAQSSASSQQKRTTKWWWVAGAVVAVSAVIVAVVVAITSNSEPSSTTDAAHDNAVHRVSASVAISRIARPGTRVVDVRTPSEFASGHLPNALNIDVRASSFNSDVALLDKYTTYVVYCHSGNRSRTATSIMSEAGFKSLYDVEGGITALESADATIVKS